MKILWFLDKQFDIALDKATWIEVISHLQKNHIVHLVTGFKKDKIQFDELNKKIIYFESSYIPFLNRIITYHYQVKCFRKLVKIHKPDVVFLNVKNFVLVKEVKNFRKKHQYKAYLDIRSLPVYSSRLKNTLDSYLFKKSLKIAANKFDGVTYITDEIRQYCVMNYDLKEHRSEIWTSGVNTDLFEPETRTSPDNTFRLIYHGNIADNRGLDNVITALRNLGDLDIEFLMLGSGIGANGLKNLAGELKLDKRVRIHSPVPYKDVPKYINEADAGILPFQDCPGWNTSSPIKLFEYLSCGKPVVATRIPAHTNVLLEKNFVSWAEKSSPEAFSKAIMDVYNNREEYKKAC